ncbi:MAG: hypothetical protein H5T69_19345, partial [Chloroflexi bacterium]|nr:hypothetical protein [Chloroflexota bacterium]
RPVVWAALILLPAIAFYLHAGIAEALDYVKDNARRETQLGELRKVLSEDARAWGQAEVIVMTRNPWEVHEATGFKALQIPNNDRDTILRLAERFGANYLLLPAPRPALNALNRNPQSDPRFAFVAKVPGSKLKAFRILPP